MEFLPSLLALAGMHFLMAMIPGSNTIVVSWLSATRSRRDGLKAVAGVVLASLIWVGCALFGVGALLLDTGWLYKLLRLAGAAYLIYVGIRMLGAGFSRRSVSTGSANRFAARSPFVTGLLTTLSNPKSAVFWTSAFLVAVPAHAPGWVYLAILVIIAVQSALWYGALALFLSTGYARAFYFRLTRYLDLVAGGVMLALGLKLANEVRLELSTSDVSP
ncbi:LysE family translocator [Nisaea sediminum]|uniref:LysE family translocator n=1 Tax=Nisaea sediminum TaxID=2775867 RepID=UPI001867F6B2|nr:LysE family translocator [Nisaea sediminum]